MKKVKGIDPARAELVHVNPSTVISSELQAADMAAMRADLAKRNRADGGVTPKIAYAVGKREISKRHPHFFDD